MSDLWPEDIQSVKALAPVTIVREQGIALGKKTKNLVIGKVKEYPTVPGRFAFRFAITAPALRYEYELFRFEYGVELYPVNIYPDDAIMKELERSGVPKHPGVHGLCVEAESEEDFLKLLSRIFASEKSRKVVTAVMSQVQHE
jgi:hypothetical protein